MDTQQQPQKPARRLYPIPPAIERARVWVDSNWRQNPSLHQVAAEVRISRFYFHRLFKRLTGKTLKNYVDDLRMAEARRLLLDGVGIKQVSVHLGFSNHSHFTARFRRRIGVAPSRWVKSQTEMALKDAA